mmetsp:Transcript_75005/g.160647  ORF Transcript_75005/g.160647 Transcript_75005/m.160647 type:complete len:638 (-) Transcript_75005:131-2044(-)
MDSIEEFVRAWDANPRERIINGIVESLSKEMHEKVWEVIGGGEAGGIVVRQGSELSSAQAKERLSAGALVRERRRIGSRLEYQILDGDGPIGGWISTKIKDAFLLREVEETAEAKKRIAILTRRLAMLPRELDGVAKIDTVRSLELTKELYGHEGLLMKVDCTLWHRAATHCQFKRTCADYPAFPVDDPILTYLLEDPRLKPLRKVFPQPAGMGSDECQFVPCLDAVDGLLPDATSVAYFVGMSDQGQELLRGAARFGPQGAGTIVRAQTQVHYKTDAEALQAAYQRGETTADNDEGETSPTNHGGSTMAVLYDAALCLTRVSKSAAAIPVKIACTLGKPCPLLHTLYLEANFLDERVNGKVEQDTCRVAVKLMMGETVVTEIEILFNWRSGRQIKAFDSFPEKSILGAPCIDWVPRELALAHAPSSFTQEGWDRGSYNNAACVDKGMMMKFPKRCGPRYNATQMTNMKNQGWSPHVRANRPFTGAKFRSDLAYASGLTPAAISHTKWYNPTENQFDGVVKFGPQASDAWFLDEGAGQATPQMSMVAHYGMVLAVLDEFAAHLPRLKPGLMTVTWQFEADMRCMVPIGEELQIRTWTCNTQKPKLDHPAAILVTAQILNDKQQILVSADITLFGSWW